MRERLVVAGLALTLLVVSIGGLVRQARDVDVLLYMAAASRANAEGALPYVAAWIEKGPLAMGLFQAIGAVCGSSNFVAVGVAWLALAAAGMLLVRVLARELGAGWGADLAALVFVVSLHAVGGSLNTEVPALVAASGALLAWLRTLRPGEEGLRARRAAVAGLLCGVAFLCRQNAGGLWAILLAAEGALVASGRRARRDGVIAAAALTAGFAALPAIVVGVYAATGQWEAFRFCFWGYNADIYVAATHVTWGRVLASPVEAARSFLVPVPSAALAGALGILLALRRGGDLRARVTAAVALGLTLSMFAGLRFFSHYFALALPFWAALSGWAVERLPRRASRVALAAVLALVAWKVVDRPWADPVSSVREWIADGGWRTPSDALRWCGRERFPARVARYLRDEGSPTDRVFVWGKRPHVYVYSGLVPATRFVTCTFLTGLVPWERVAPFEDTTPWIVPGAWDLLMSDLDRDEPRWIVDASHDHLFGDGAYAPEKFPRLAGYLAAHYEKVWELGEGDRFVVWKRTRE